MFGLGRKIDPATFKPIKTNTFTLFILNEDKSNFGCFRGVLRVFKLNTAASADWKFLSV